MHPQTTCRKSLTLSIRKSMTRAFVDQLKLQLSELFSLHVILAALISWSELSPYFHQLERSLSSSVHQEHIYDLCWSSRTQVTVLVHMGFFDEWCHLGVISTSLYGSGAVNSSRFFADPFFSVWGVEGLCLGVLNDRARAFVDAVAAMYFGLCAGTEKLEQVGVWAAGLYLSSLWQRGLADCILRGFILTGDWGTGGWMDNSDILWRGDEVV